MPAALSASHLGKRYGTRVAVDDVSLEVAPGDLYGFLGPNGAGKTTTIRMLLGLVRPTTGEVRLLGERGRGALARVGAIVEAPSFYGYLSGRDNLRLLADLSGGTTRARIDAVLERVDLRERAGDPVRVYSHGMKQRLAIAAALLPGPELILLDEPTNGLDPMGIRDVRALLRSLSADDKLTVFLSSHLLAEVEQLCTRGAIVVSGRVRWEGAVGELLGARRRIRLDADPIDVAVRVVRERWDVALDGGAMPASGPGGAIDPADVVDALVAAAVRVRAISLDTPTLEDVFVELVETS